jgi:molybdopterin/thiamine biosynthesis adenylyltransferase
LKVKVVGCGGVGLCVLNVLPRYLSYLKDHEVQLSLIDGDSYEEHNKSRQGFTRRGNKADVTAENIRNEFSNLFCWTTTDYLTEDNVAMVIRDGDIVFSCVDNHATRKLLSDRCEQLENVVMISGGNEYEDGNIQIHVRENGQNVTWPIANKYHPEILNPVDKNPGQREERIGCSARQTSQPQLLITNNMVAALMLCAFYGWLQGRFEGKKEYDEVYCDINLNRTNPRLRN